MKARLGPVLLALSLPMLPGCFYTFSQPKLPIQSRMSAAALRIEVPFVPQEKPYLCGLASATMITRYYQQPFAADRAAGLSQLAKTEQGLSGADLKSALQEAGYFVAVFPGSLDHSEVGLYTELDQKRPLVVMLGSTARHYCVLAGYDEAQGTVDLVDPDSGERLMGKPEFLKAWDESNRFSLLALPSALLAPGAAQGSKDGHAGN